MVSFFKIVGRVILTTLLLVGLTRYAARPEQPASPQGSKAGIASESRLHGYPLISIVQKDARGVIAIGQTAYGVLVFAQGGGGLITFAQGGVGVLFGLGQGMVGLLAICQIGVGLFFLLAQLGGGTFCLGQVVFGYAGAGQAAGVARGMDYLKELNEETEELLAYRVRSLFFRQAPGEGVIRPRTTKPLEINLRKKKS
jgi:hypothetical protein